MIFGKRKQYAGIIIFLLLFAVPNGCSWFSGGGGKYTVLENQVFDSVNRYRYDQEVPLFKWRDTIADEAREHSRNMAEGKVPPGHNGAEGRRADIGKRFRVNAFAENVAQSRGYGDPARETVQGWINSPEHKKNLDGNFDLTGVGVAVSADSTYYVTQIYIRSR
ncbi:MAG: CAP domain-containing protein [Candidatus Latescibacterota bacterium]